MNRGLLFALVALLACSQVQQPAHAGIFDSIAEGLGNAASAVSGAVTGAASEERGGRTGGAAEQAWNTLITAQHASAVTLQAVGGAAGPVFVYRRVAAAATLLVNAAATAPLCCADAVAGVATDAWDKVSGWSEDAWNKVRQRSATSLRVQRVAAALCHTSPEDLLLAMPTQQAIPGCCPARRRPRTPL